MGDQADLERWKADLISDIELQAHFEVARVNLEQIVVREA
jgi:hypothetical protein